MSGHLLSYHRALAPQGKPVRALAPQGKPVRALAPQGKPVRALTPQGKPVGALAPQGKPVRALAPQGKPVRALTPQGKPVRALAPQGKPVRALAPQVCVCFNSLPALSRNCPRLHHNPQKTQNTLYGNDKNVLELHQLCPLSSTLSSDVFYSPGLYPIMFLPQGRRFIQHCDLE